MNVLIIGGSTDIGISLAKQLVNKGYGVISTYNKHRVDIPLVETCQCDVRSEEDILRVISLANKRFNNDYVLINMASISMDNSILNKTKKEMMSVLEVNLVGMFLCNQIYARYNSGGLIINISSTDGIDTYSEYNLDYALSKNGIVKMSEIMGHYIDSKIICICPNWIDSDSTREMNQEYLISELKRINQSRLISVDEVTTGITSIVEDGYYKRMNKDTEIIRIDIKDDRLWIERI